MIRFAYICGVFRSRECVERTISILREEGFRSPDFTVLVSPSTSSMLRAVGASHGDRPRFTPIDTCVSWLAGVVWTQARYEEYSSRLSNAAHDGGLLLIVRAASRDAEQIAREVLEDAEADEITCYPTELHPLTSSLPSESVTASL